MEKNKQENKQKANQTTTFKNKQNKGNCNICSNHVHWASGCIDRKWKQDKKSANMVVSETKAGTSEYGNCYLLFFHSIIHLSGGLILGLIFTYVMMLLCILLT